MKLPHIFILGALVIMVTINTIIIDKELTIPQSSIIKIELRPVDPRSLMQGDYMRLRYNIPSIIIKAHPKGQLKLTLDANHFVTQYSLYEGEPLKENQRLLNFKSKKYGRVHIGSESFLFQEGKAKHYAKATHAIFYLTPSGGTILKDLYVPPKKE
jgi:uncharacterized membrane-anchored protein